MSVWKQLQGFSDKNLVHAGVNGDRLRIERNRADYEADLKNVANMTMPALFKSKAVLKYLR